MSIVELITRKVAEYSYEVDEYRKPTCLYLGSDEFGDLVSFLDKEKRTNRPPMVKGRMVYMGMQVYVVDEINHLEVG